MACFYLDSDVNQEIIKDIRSLADLYGEKAWRFTQGCFDKDNIGTDKRHTILGHCGTLNRLTDESMTYGDQDLTAAAFVDKLIEFKLPTDTQIIDLLGCQIGLLKDGTTFAHEVAKLLHEKGYPNIQVNALMNSPGAFDKSYFETTMKFSNRSVQFEGISEAKISQYEDELWTLDSDALLNKYTSTILVVPNIRAHFDKSPEFQITSGNIKKQSEMIKAFYAPIIEYQNKIIDKLKEYISPNQHRQIQRFIPLLYTKEQSKQTYKLIESALQNEAIRNIFSNQKYVDIIYNKIGGLSPLVFWQFLDTLSQWKDLKVETLQTIIDNIPGKGKNWKFHQTRYWKNLIELSNTRLPNPDDIPDIVNISNQILTPASEKLQLQPILNKSQNYLQNSGINVREKLIESQLTPVQARGNKALHYAVLANSISDLESLIQQKIDLTKKNYSGFTALEYACTLSNNAGLSALKYLHKAGSALVNDEKMTTGHIAAKYGNKDCLEYCITHGVNINAIDSNGRPMLSYALEHGHFESAKFLMAESKEFKITQTEILTTLKNSHANCVKLLLDYSPALIHTKDDNNDTLLDIAIKNRDVNSMLVLLDKSPNNEQANRIITEYIAIALKENRSDQLIELIKYSPAHFDLKENKSFISDIVHNHADKNNLQLLAELIYANKHNLKDMLGLISSYKNILSSMLETIINKIQLSDDILHQTDKISPHEWLNSAIKMNNLDAIKLICNKFPETLTTLDINQQCPLSRALSTRKLEAAELLINLDEKGMSFDCVSKFGFKNSPFGQAAGDGLTKLCDMMLAKRGKDLNNHIYGSSQTPLAASIIYKHTDTTKLLLKYGMNINDMLPENNKSVIQQVLENDNDSVSELVKFIDIEKSKHILIDILNALPKLSIHNFTLKTLFTELPAILQLKDENGQTMQSKLLQKAISLDDHGYREFIIDYYSKNKLDLSEKNEQGKSLFDVIIEFHKPALFNKIYPYSAQKDLFIINFMKAALKNPSDYMLTNCISVFSEASKDNASEILKRFSLSEKEKIFEEISYISHNRKFYFHLVETLLSESKESIFKNDKHIYPFFRNVAKSNANELSPFIINLIQQLSFDFFKEIREETIEEKTTLLLTRTQLIEIIQYRIDNYINLKNKKPDDDKINISNALHSLIFSAQDKSNLSTEDVINLIKRIIPRTYQGPGSSQVIHQLLTEFAFDTKILTELVDSIPNKAGIFCSAIRNNNLKLAEFMIKYDSTLINKLDSNGDIPLLLACKTGNTDLIKLLLSNNPNLTITNKKKETPLIFAIKSSKSDVAELLIQHFIHTKQGDNTTFFDHRDIQGDTALMYAADLKLHHIASLLLKSGANPNVQNLDPQGQYTALHLADAKFSLELIDMDKKGDLINTQDFSKNTKLMIEIENKNSNMTLIKKIIHHPYNDLNLKNDDGDTVFVLAIKNSKLDILRLLLDKMNHTIQQSKEQQESMISLLKFATQNNHTEAAKLITQVMPFLLPTSTLESKTDSVNTVNQQLFDLISLKKLTSITLNNLIDKLKPIEQLQVLNEAFSNATQQRKISFDNKQSAHQSTLFSPADPLNLITDKFIQTVKANANDATLTAYAMQSKIELPQELRSTLKK